MEIIVELEWSFEPLTIPQLVFPWALNLANSLNIQPLTAWEIGQKYGVTMNVRHLATYFCDLDTIGLQNSPHYSATKNPVTMSLALLHEIIHCTGHSTRLNRDRISHWENHPRGKRVVFTPNEEKIFDRQTAQEEIVAELGAHKLIERLGFYEPILKEELNFYIKYWSKHEPDMVQAEIDANKAVEYVLDMAKQKAA